jgi:hypothetical protein
MAFTYYVKKGGSDLATGLTELLAWATIDHAMNTVAAGDKVYVKANGNYAELATIDTAGTAAAPIIFEGYTTTPGDGGRAVITGSSVRANCVTDSLAADTLIYYVFKNFSMTAATGAGLLTDCSRLTFKNCKFDTNGTIGLSCRTTVCEACEFSSNGTNGVTTSSAGGVGGIFIGCKFYSNTGRGLSGGLGLVVFGCTFFNNGGDNIRMGGGGGTLSTVLNCTFDGNAKNSDSGISWGPCDALAYVNNVLYDCDTGVAGDANMGESICSRNNLVNANTTAYTNAATFTGEVTSAPQFVNESGGADYHPATNSPLRDAGFDGGASMDIGAVQSVAGAASNVFKLRIGV